MLIIEKLNLKEKMSEGEESIADFVLTLGKDIHSIRLEILQKQLIHLLQQLYVYVKN